MEFELTLQNLEKRAFEEAEKLTQKIDKLNSERDCRPLIESRDQFVFFLASQLARMVMRRATILPSATTLRALKQ